MNPNDKCTCLGLRTVLLGSVAAVALVVWLITRDGTDHFAIDVVPAPPSAASPATGSPPPASGTASPVGSPQIATGNKP